jgi:hypothetical protein
MTTISGATEGDLPTKIVSATRPLGVARPCGLYASELARDRVVTPDGQDYVVTTADDVRLGTGYLTGAYPVKSGYLVMMRQPLVEYHSATASEARELHQQLSSVLAQAGSRVVRARAQLLARKARETYEAAREAKRANKAAQALQPELTLLPSAGLTLEHETVSSFS